MVKHVHCHIQNFKSVNRQVLVYSLANVFRDYTLLFTLKFAVL